MIYKGMLKVNGVWIPSPTTFDFAVEDLDLEAFRTADGLMHRQRIGSKINLSCTWEEIPEPAEFYELVELLNSLPEFFPVQFPHPNGDNAYVMTAYRAASMTTPMRGYYYDRQAGKISTWHGLKTKFIER